MSRHPQADLYVPLADTGLHLTREEFDKIARPLIERTVEVTVATLQASRVPREEIAGVFLVGGSSRVPLAATMLHQALGIEPTVTEQPETVVAAGSLRAGAHSAPAPVDATTAVVEDPPMPDRQSVTVAPLARADAVAVDPANGAPDRSAPLPDRPQRADAHRIVAAAVAEVSTMRFSPDGTLVAFAFGGVVRLFKTATGQQEGGDLDVSGTGYGAAVVSLAISRDNTLLATANKPVTGGGPNRLWSVTSHRQIAELPDAVPYGTQTQAMAFSSEGDLLAGASVGSVQLWDTTTYKPTGKVFTRIGESSRVVAFTPDGTKLLANWSFWNIDGSPGYPGGIDAITESGGATLTVLDAAFNSAGTRVALVSPAKENGNGPADATVRLIDTKTCAQVGKQFVGHDGSVHRVALSPDNTTMADHTVRLWNIAE
ncbi:Hsp70 family protein [Dactylosporangium sp. NPDC049742]|uniref:WD40 repeat domain-containing protein n=1 Tax=Dactylosporangium sp. NPDC049742 TaxID=3154737 RepID=UPI003419FC9C